MQLKDKVFVVTGAGNGMGRQVALGLLSQGARVALVDLSPSALEETLQLAPAGARASTHVVNVSDSDAVSALPDLVIAAHGTVDGLVNVAGTIHRFAPVTELDSNECQRIINVNLWGTVNMCMAFLPVLRQRPVASLVNISSLSALIPFAGQTFYGATKAAVKQFSEGLYQELSGSNIAVTTVFPGNISTNISANSGVKMIDAGGRKVRATGPEAAGSQIVEAIKKGSFRAVIGADARILDALVRLSPKRATDIIARQMKSVL